MFIAARSAMRFPLSHLRAQDRSRADSAGTDLAACGQIGAHADCLSSHELPEQPMIDSTADARRDARQSTFDPRRLLRPLRGVFELLPPEPASLPLAQALNQMLLPRLDATSRAGLALRVIKVQFTDLGVLCRVALDAGGIAGFSPAPRHLAIAAHLSARSDDLWRLARGRTDVDTLMVQDALLIQAEPTEMMLIRQALAALGPPRLSALLPPSPRQAIDALRSASIVAWSLLPGGGRR